MIERVRRFDDATWQRFGEMYELIEGDDRHLVPADHAWYHLHGALKTTGLGDRFTLLWADLAELLTSRAWGGYLVRCAICAAMLTPFVETGQMNRADHDCLLAPWRAVLESCTRSRTFLSMCSRWPHPAEELWPLVDAVLAPPEDG